MQHMLPTLRIQQTATLPDNGVWRYRFNVKSETSNRLYIISQHKDKLHWGCSCPGWKAHRHCKHLAALGIPGDEKPYPVNVINS